jgi:hypothetical protein
VWLKQLGVEALAGVFRLKAPLLNLARAIAFGSSSLLNVILRSAAEPVLSEAEGKNLVDAVKLLTRTGFFAPCGRSE